MKRIKRFILIFLMVILICAITMGTLIGNLFYNIALNSNVSKDIVYASSSGDEVYDDEKWLVENSNYTDEYITSKDNLKLHAYVVKQSENTNKWAIVVHGYGGEGKLMSSKAMSFYNMGYNVLIPDLRGHGKSEGDYIGMGWDDRFDIISWINHIIKSDSNAEIVLHGTSMGAATVLMTSGENLPSNVKAIVSDCAYTSAWDIFNYELKTYLNIGSFPIMNFSNLVTRVKAGYSLKGASAIEQVKKTKIPILYIHGDSDKFVPPSMMDELYNATNSPKEKLIVEGAKHANSDLINPKIYWNTIYNFLGNYVK